MRGVSWRFLAWLGLLQSQSQYQGFGGLERNAAARNRKVRAEARLQLWARVEQVEPLEAIVKLGERVEHRVDRVLRGETGNQRVANAVHELDLKRAPLARADGELGPTRDSRRRQRRE